MLETLLMQLLLLLGLTLPVVLLFQRLNIPPVLAYLLVGVLLGPHTGGFRVDAEYIPAIAEFGIVFLLFTIGLSFPASHIYAQRHQILGLGTSQVVLTTLVVWLVLWLAGVDGAVAFVLGAVFAQSSTTVIARQLEEQGEAQSRHGRTGITMSVFQDITAVPFIIIIPVLGMPDASPLGISSALGFALIKAAIAFVLVFIGGRYLLTPLFRLVTARRSAETFTITVLFVSLFSAWLTNAFGLSMAFGAFLAGMMLAETQFRFQVDSTIRPFRDVLLGLFFVSIGMLFDFSTLPQIWPQVLVGTFLLITVKWVLVTGLVHIARYSWETAFRTGIMLSVGGEFGFALIAIAVSGEIINDEAAQIALTSVLLAMIVGAFLIKYNYRITSTIFRSSTGKSTALNAENKDIREQVPDEGGHVVICGFGRIGHIVAQFFREDEIRYVATDLDPFGVQDARAEGHPVYYGDSADPQVLEAIGVEKAALIILCIDDMVAARQTLSHIRRLNTVSPVLVRTADDLASKELIAAGATEVIPETLETGMMLVTHALRSLNLPLRKVARYIEQQRTSQFHMLREMFRDDPALHPAGSHPGNLHPVTVNAGAEAEARTLAVVSAMAQGVTVVAILRDDVKLISPTADEMVRAGDVLVLYGGLEDVKAAEGILSQKRAETEPVADA